MNKVLLFLSCFFFFLSVNAQYNTISPYSRYGIGILENQVLGRALGMGSVSSAIRLPFEINSENPASYTAIPNKIFLFQVGIKAKRTDFKSSLNKITNYDVWFSSINMAFRVNKFWAMSIGLSPLSSVGYDIYTEDSVIVNNYQANFENNYSGEGGVTKIYFGNAFAYKGISMGINASYLFGPVIKNTETVLIDEDYTSILNINENIKVNDFNFKYGIQYNDSIFKKYNFVIGASLETKSDINAKIIRFTTEKISLDNSVNLTDTIINDTLIQGKIGLPLQYSAGITFLTPKMIFSVDYKTALWDDVKFFDDTTDFFANSSEIAFGTEYTHDYASKQYLKTINFRAGARFANTNLILYNQQIKDYSVTFGAGFPTSTGTKINIAFEIGKKGTIDNNLIMENYYLMHLNFNMTDNWFIRRKFF